MTGVSLNKTGVVVLVVVTGWVTHYTINAFQNMFPASSVGAECHQECLSAYMAGSPHKHDPDLLEALKEEFLHPPPKEPDETPFDYSKPIWRELLDWYQVQDTLMELWKDTGPGVFVEVGAVDGEFMSQTLLLEKNLSWTGLLIEPDHRSYAILRERKRNAWTSPLCIYPKHPFHMKLWMMNLVDDLPQEYLTLFMARSKLAFELLEGDWEQGTKEFVLCVSLSTVLLAMNMTEVDLLSIATGIGGDEKKIADVTRDTERFNIKTLLIQYPRVYLKENPYPEVKGYIYDMERSFLLVRLYWRESHCRLMESGNCRRIKFYDLVPGCLKYLCLGQFTVWTYE